MASQSLSQWIFLLRLRALLSFLNCMLSFRMFGVKDFMNIFKFLVRVVFGNAIAFFLFLVPMTTLKRIMKKNKFTEEYLSGIPYLMTLLLSAAWYGLPFVSPNNIFMSTINTIGAAIEAIYLLIVFLLAPKMEKEQILELLTYALSFKQREDPKKIKETLST